MKQSPLFSQTYDFVLWILPVTIKFPRQQRFVMAATLQRESLRFQELIIEASHQKQPLEMLTAADAELDKIRAHVRMSLDLGLIDPGQYEHAARMMVNMGNLMGGWLRKVNAPPETEPGAEAESQPSIPAKTIPKAKRGQAPLL